MGSDLSMLTDIDGIGSVEEVRIDTSMSDHSYEALVFGDSVFLVCFYQSEDIAILADVSREKYILNYDDSSIEECVDFKSSGVSGIYIDSSALIEEEKETIYFCDSCFEGLQSEIEAVVEENSEIVASNMI